MYVCILSGFFTGPSALTVNNMKNMESLSIVVQWNVADNFLDTTYTITWTDERDLFEVATLQEETSHTITGLTLDTVYTISVTASNACGDGPEFRSRISFPTGTFHYSYLPFSPTVTASTL